MRLEARAALIAQRGVQLAVGTSALPASARLPTETYLLVVCCNLPQALAAEVRGCSKQNIGNLLGDVRALREDPAIDAELSRLEAALLGE